MSLTKWGSQTCGAYSKCGQINALYSQSISWGLQWWKRLYNIPVSSRTLEQILVICSVQVRSDVRITPRYFTESTCWSWVCSNIQWRWGDRVSTFAWYKHTATFISMEFQMSIWFYWQSNGCNIWLEHCIVGWWLDVSVQGYVISK